MHSTLKTTFLLSLLVLIAGCNAVGRSIGGIQAGYETAVMRAHDEREQKFSDELTEFAIDWCSTFHKTDREKFVACAMRIYDGFMAKRQQLSQQHQSQQKRYIQSGNVIPTNPGQPVYNADECIGSIVNGVCHGSIQPKSAYRAKCYGQMLNGICTGPMF